MEACNIINNYNVSPIFNNSIKNNSSALYIMPPKPLRINNKEVKCLNVSSGNLDELLNVDILKDFLSSAKTHMSENIKDYEITRMKVKDINSNEINVYLKSFKSLNDGELKSALIIKGKDSKSADSKLFNAHYFMKTNPVYKCITGGDIDSFKYSELKDRLSRILSEESKNFQDNKPISKNAQHSTSALYIFNSNGTACLAKASGEKIIKDINQDEGLLAPFLIATQSFINEGMFNNNCELDSIELKKDCEKISMHFRKLKIFDKEIKAVAVFKGKVDNFELNKKMMDIQFEFKKWYEYINDFGCPIPEKVDNEIKECLDKLLK